MEYREKLALLKAELATFENVPCFMLRTLRVCELRCEHLALESQRLDASLAARNEITALRDLADARFTAEAVGDPRPEGPDDIAAEAEAVIVVRDMQLLPVEASIALVSAEVGILEDPEFALLFDAESLGRDAAAAVRRFVSEHPEHPLSATFSAAEALLTRPTG